MRCLIAGSADEHSQTRGKSQASRTNSSRSTDGATDVRRACSSLVSTCWTRCKHAFQRASNSEATNRFSGYRSACGDPEVALSTALLLEYEAVCTLAEHRLAAGLDSYETGLFLDAIAYFAEAVEVHY